MHLAEVLIEQLDVAARDAQAGGTVAEDAPQAEHARRWPRKERAKVWPRICGEPRTSNPARVEACCTIPAERLVFVLHDTFELRFEEIAQMIDRSPAAARQLASRARRLVRGAEVPTRSRCRRRWLSRPAYRSSASPAPVLRLVRRSPQLPARAYR